jgi:hypothetical protein
MFIILYNHYLPDNQIKKLVVKVKISNLNKYMAICCQNGKGTMIILHSKQWKKSKTNEEFGAWNKCKV